MAPINAQDIDENVFRPLMMDSSTMIVLTVIFSISTLWSLMVIIIWCACCRGQEKADEEGRLGEWRHKHLLGEPKEGEQRSKMNPNHPKKLDVHELMKLQKRKGRTSKQLDGKWRKKCMLVLVIDDTKPNSPCHSASKKKQHRSKGKDRRQQEKESANGNSEEEKKIASVGRMKKDRPRVKLMKSLVEELMHAPRERPGGIKEKEEKRRSPSPEAKDQDKIRLPSPDARSQRPPASTEAAPDVNQSGLTPPRSLRPASVAPDLKSPVASTRPMSLQPVVIAEPSKVGESVAPATDPKPKTDDAGGTKKSVLASAKSMYPPNS